MKSKIFDNMVIPKYKKQIVMDMSTNHMIKIHLKNLTTFPLGKALEIFNAILSL